MMHVHRSAVWISCNRHRNFILSPLGGTVKSCTCHQVTRRDLQDLSLEVLNAMQNGRIVTDSHTRSTVQVPGTLSSVSLSRVHVVPAVVTIMFEMQAPGSFQNKLKQ